MTQKLLPRNIPKDIRAEPPAKVMFQMLRAQNGQQEDAKRLTAAEQKRADNLARDTALAVFACRSLIASLPQEAGVKLQTIEAALRTNGVELVEYTGRIVTPELLEELAVEGWQDGDGPEDIVCETFSPEVRWHERRLKAAQVFCRRAAATPQQDGKSAPESAALQAAGTAPEPVPVQAADIVSDTTPPQNTGDTSGPAQPKKKTGRKRHLFRK